MKRLFCSIISKYLVLFLILLSGCSSKKKEFNDLSGKRKIYSETAKIKPVFIPLNLGEITPEGWIKDWAEDALKGITAHLDEYSASVYEGWTGLDFFEVRGADPGGTGWPLIISANWLDGAVRLAYIMKDSALINKTSKRLNKVVNGVLNGGETFVYWVPKSELSEFDHWGHASIGRDLVAYYQATHDEKILQVLVKVYKQYSIGDLEYVPEASGASNIDAMIETYLLSGEKAILDSVLSFSNRASYKSLSVGWSKGDLFPSHGGAYYALLHVPAILYTWTGDKMDLDASLKALEWYEKGNLLPTGICSGEEWIAGIGATRNTETCNITWSTVAFLWMLRITGEKSFADRIEKIFFNAAPAPVSRDFKIMCYYQSPNRYSNTLPGEEPVDPGPNKGSYKFSKVGNQVQCCVANIGRNIPIYISNMWMATMDNGLAATLYGPCKVHTIVSDKIPVNIDCQTSYPFEETINITVNPARDIDFPLYLRIPEWCRNPEIKINETAFDLKKESNEFMVISRIWKKNDKIKLYFPMTPQVSKGRETPYPQIDYFHGDANRKIAKDTTINSPYGYVYCGPLVFSLAIPDKNPNQEMPDAKFNYALDVNSDSDVNQIGVIRHAMPGKWNWSLDAPIQLRVKVKEFNWKPTENQPLPKELIRSGNSTFINLIPYGCTKFRVTMFPVTETSWNSLSDKSKVIIN